MLSLLVPRPNVWEIVNSRQTKTSDLWIGSVESIIALAYKRFRPGAKLKISNFKITNDHSHNIKLFRYQFDLQSLKRSVCGGKAVDMYNLKHPIYFCEEMLRLLPLKDRGFLIGLAIQGLENLLSETYAKDEIAKECLHQLRLILDILEENTLRKEHQGSESDNSVDSFLTESTESAESTESEKEDSDEDDDRDDRDDRDDAEEGSDGEEEDSDVEEEDNDVEKGVGKKSEKANESISVDKDSEDTDFCLFDESETQNRGKGNSKGNSKGMNNAKSNGKNNGKNNAQTKNKSKTKAGSQPKKTVKAKTKTGARNNNKSSRSKTRRRPKKQSKNPNGVCDDLYKQRTLLRITHKYMENPLTKRNRELWKDRKYELRKICQLFRRAETKVSVGKEPEEFLSEIKKILEPINEKMYEFYRDIIEGK